MRAIFRSFARHFDGLRFVLALFVPAFIILMAVNTSPGASLHPITGNDTDGVPSVAVVVE